MTFLMDRGIRTIKQWGGKAVHQLERLGFDRDRFSYLEKTNWFFERCLLLPMHMSLTDTDVDYICEQILEFYEING